MNSKHEIIKTLIEKDPLYKKREYQGDFLLKEKEVKVIEYHCTKCNKERTFQATTSEPQRGSGYGRNKTTSGEPILNSSILPYEFQCTFCSKKAHFWIELNSTENWLRKVGQNPPWSIEIESDLKKYLGQNETFYKKGLICLSQSFGLGACSYFRRVVENEINPLLNLLIKKKKDEGDSNENIEEYQKIKDGKSFTDKTKLAYEITPESLIIDGVNPFKELHDLLSQGIHSKTEDECIKIALKTKEIIEFIVVELNRAKNNREKFKQNIKDITN